LGVKARDAKFPGKNSPSALRGVSVISHRSRLPGRDLRPVRTSAHAARPRSRAAAKDVLPSLELEGVPPMPRRAALRSHSLRARYPPADPRLRASGEVRNPAPWPGRRRCARSPTRCVSPVAATGHANRAGRAALPVAPVARGGCAAGMRSRVACRSGCWRILTSGARQAHPQCCRAAACRVAAHVVKHKRGIHARALPYAWAWRSCATVLVSRCPPDSCLGITQVYPSCWYRRKRSPALCGRLLSLVGISRQRPVSRAHARMPDQR
jgi:hypothetical protein